MLTRKLWSRFLTGAVFVAAFAGAPPVSAQEPDYFSLAPEQLLDAEVISVSKKTEKLSHTSAAVYVITHDDIVRSGVTNIPDALRMAPGVDVAQADSNTWAVSIRGFNNELAHSLLVLIDGRTIYNPLHGGVYWEGHDLTLEDIDRIEVIRGPGGAVWGANAVNGVINIIRKHTRETQGTLVEGIAGTHERGTVAVRKGGTFSPDNTYRLYAKYFNRDSFRKPDGGDNHDDWDGYRTGARFDWGDKLMLSTDWYSTNSDQFYQDFFLTAPFSATIPETATTSGGNITGRWNQIYDNGAQLSVNSYLDYTSRDEHLLGDERVIFDTEVQYNFAPLDRQEIITGIGYRFVHDDLSGSNLVAFNPASRSDSIFSAFAQDKITLVPDSWWLTLGSKLEHNYYTGVEIQPTVRTMWMPDPTQSVWAAVSRAVRMPSRVERDLDITNLVVGPALLGQPAQLTLTHNENFDSEDLTAYEIGYRNQIRPDLSVDIATFYNEYKNLGSLQAGTITNPPGHLDVPLIYVNAKSAETLGGELVLGWNVNRNWTLTGTYSYLNLVAHSPTVLGFSQEGVEGQSPQQQASLQSSWNINEDFSLNSKLYYVDELPQYDVDSYVRFDLNFGWRINDNVKFNLVGQNLLDNAHREFNGETSPNAAEIERSVFGKLTWQF